MTRGGLDAGPGVPPRRRHHLALATSPRLAATGSRPWQQPARRPACWHRSCCCCWRRQPGRSRAAASRPRAACTHAAGPAAHAKVRPNAKRMHERSRAGWGTQRAPLPPPASLQGSPVPSRRPRTCARCVRACAFGLARRCRWLLRARRMASRRPASRLPPSQVCFPGLQRLSADDPGNVFGGYLGCKGRRLLSWANGLLLRGGPRGEPA